jgi:hypothetical protein
MYRIIEQQDRHSNIGKDSVIFMISELDFFQTVSIITFIHKLLRVHMNTDFAPPPPLTPIACIQ